MQYGFGPVVVAAIWNLLTENLLVPHTGSLVHVLWMLSFFKNYNSIDVHLVECGTSYKTFIKYVYEFSNAIASLKDEVVSNSIGNVFYILFIKLCTNLVYRFVWTIVSKLIMVAFVS